MNVREQLRLAQQAAATGRFEEALEGYIWYHDNALAHDPAQAGVRLSFAIGYWLELGRVYPPALAALKGIRDNKAKKLSEGHLDRGMFHDVSSINRELDEEDQTYRLFLHIASTVPAFAAKCFSMAVSAIVAHGDFALARQFVEDPDGTIRRWAKRLNEDLEYLATQAPSPAPREAAEISIYTEDVARLLKILLATGEASEASRLRAVAIECVTSPTARRAVEHDLTI